MERQRTGSLPPIRRARPGEAEALTALTLRSKASWGYDAEFMAQATPELTFLAEKFAPEFLVFVIEADGDYWGFSSLIPAGEATVELHDLFVDPSHFGMGVGTMLWEHAAGVARSRGCRRITLTADPNAEQFYVRQGATRVGFVESRVLGGRKLPRMEYLIPDARGGTT